MYAKKLLWPIITAIFPLLLAQTVLAAIGESQGYILNGADTTNGASIGTSPTYGLEGISGDSLGGKSSSTSYKLCAGFIEENFGDCSGDTPEPPPSEPPPSEPPIITDNPLPQPPTEPPAQPPAEPPAPPPATPEEQPETTPAEEIAAPQEETTAPAEETAAPQEPAIPTASPAPPAIVAAILPSSFPASSESSSAPFLSILRNDVSCGITTCNGEPAIISPEIASRFPYSRLRLQSQYQQRAAALSGEPNNTAVPAPLWPLLVISTGVVTSLYGVNNILIASKALKNGIKLTGKLRGKNKVIKEIINQLKNEK